MTQIKGTFEGCGEAPAPLKLNEVFISRADSILKSARSRAVTVNVSLQSIGCLFSPANGPERSKGQIFFPPKLLFIFAGFLSPSLFLTPGIPSLFLFCLTLLSHPLGPRTSLSCLSSGRKLVCCGFLLDLEATE